jgi:DNA (cytosine-5)-methyltransferase 1
MVNPYTVAELFAGAGGLALGMHNAGLRCEMLVENNKDAVATLKKNKPDWPVIFDDIANVDFKNINADVVTGGFPCQAFSYAGKKLGFEDTRGTLFFEYARAVKEIQPSVIIAENVKGLEKHNNGRTLSTILGSLNDLNYGVSHRILRSQYFDVAQKRERLVIVGIKKELNLKFAFPKEQGYTLCLKDVLHGVPASAGQSYPEKKRQVLELVPQGGCWRNLPEAIKKEYMGASYFSGGGQTGMARRLSWDEPSLTLMCSPTQKQTDRCHPSETRPLTIREYARIQSFPDEWAFEGSISAQYKQIGNAVPVKLGYHIGRCVIAMLNNTYDPKTMDIL